MISTDGSISEPGKIVEIEKMKFRERKIEGWRKNVKGHVVENTIDEYLEPSIAESIRFFERRRISTFIYQPFYQLHSC